ncbi:phosphotransferase enzyme family protein [Blastomyces dermatitidis ER-3]|uniref:Phosphotransferase enzyme family protein n=1 Tax=Ajellomyces dermatitidis (strain ER-3 / ATCC MYA-2586) TaxID=559297 RepID=A0ABP2EKP3_AJEDR|nr:phosphotransferase enzyme family protein [Blastomyces dermatitidis ER-3]EEQ83751.1 phosphotransferase enzyme family protein [Blastomyces dermatitidis ER-3]EQL29322.1 hypothetical protein BDFG_08049 [Blastomyces dermatitidis ATCC 26199]
MGPLKPVYPWRYSSNIFCARHRFGQRYAPRYFPHQWISRRYSFVPDRGSSPELSTDYCEFYNYTGGRWLWDEEKQLRLRYKEFNVNALQRIAAQAVGANKCEHISKVTDGGHSKVFRLVMDNGAVAIASIPYLIDGFPKYYSTASTAATMEFVRTILGIPVPKVLAWDANEDNSVGTEFILTEEARGTPLKDVWANMEARDQIAFIENLVSIHKKLLSVTFNRYGSLYFSSCPIKGSRAEVKGLISTAVQRDVMDKFTIGPTARNDFWFKERANLDIDRGPWETPLEYAMAVGQREIDWMKKHPNMREIDIDSDCPPTDDLLSPEAHNSLFDKYIRIAPLLLPKDPTLVASYLSLPPFHSENIFLEGNRISSILGWQHVWAGPLFIEASPPALVKVNGDDLTLDYPDEYKNLAEDERREIDEKIAQSVLRYAYQKFVSRDVPQLDKLFSFDFAQIRALPIQLCVSSWKDDDIARFRESLMKIQRRWDFLGIEGPIPYKFTDEELKRQADSADTFNRHQDFLDQISPLVSRCGWTSNSTYPQAVRMFAEMAREVNQDGNVDEGIKAEFQQFIDKESELEGEPK